MGNREGLETDKTGVWRRLLRVKFPFAENISREGEH